MNRHLAAAVAAVPLLVALTACGNDAPQAEFDTNDDTAAPSSETEPETGDLQSEDDTETTDTETTGTETTDTESTDAATAPIVVGGEPIAVVKTRHEAIAELQILDLAREGELVTLDFAVLSRPDVSSDCFTSFSHPTIEHAVNDFSGVTLVDTENQKQHEVVRNSAGEFVASKHECFGKGQHFAGSATFAAPPADVTEMKVVFPTVFQSVTVPLREED